MRKSLLLSFVCLAFLGGCNSISSDAVRQLIQLENGKIAEAKAQSADIAKATAQRTDAMKKTLSDLDAGVAEIKRIEAVHALIFSANQNVTSKKGVDAQAVAYLVARIYLAEDVGLDQQVRQQFNDDAAGLTDAARQLQASWANIAALQDKIVAYSHKSGLASVDPQFIAAVAGEIPGATDYLDKVLAKGKQVDGVLQQAMTLSPVGGAQLNGAHSVTQDLIDLLGRVKKGP